MDNCELINFTKKVSVIMQKKSRLFSIASTDCVFCNAIGVWKFITKIGVWKFITKICKK